MLAESESATPAPFGENSVAAQWARLLRRQARLERRGDATSDEEWDDLFRIEKFVLSGPIETRADATAKLEAVARSFSIGERNDGAEVAAIASVIRWLGAR